MNQKPCKPSELAELCGVSRKSVYGWIAAGEVKVVRTPVGRILIPAAERDRVLSTMNPAEGAPL